MYCLGVTVMMISCDVNAFNNWREVLWAHQYNHVSNLTWNPHAFAAFVLFACHCPPSLLTSAQPSVGGEVSRCPDTLIRNLWHYLPWLLSWKWCLSLTNMFYTMCSSFLAATHLNSFFLSKFILKFLRYLLHPLPPSLFPSPPPWLRFLRLYKATTQLSWFRCET